MGVGEALERLDMKKGGAMSNQLPAYPQDLEIGPRDTNGALFLEVG